MSKLVCEKCMKSFTRSDNLNRHKKTCNGVDPLLDEKQKIESIMNEYRRLQKENEELKKQNMQLQNKLSKYEIPEVEINDYSFIDYDFIEDTQLHKSLKNASQNRQLFKFVELYVTKMFEIPENRCIKLPKITSKIIKVKECNKITSKPTKEFIYEFINDMIDNVKATTSLSDIEEVKVFLEALTYSEKEFKSSIKSEYNNILSLFLEE